MLGSFSNNGLGFGVAFRLEDEFSRTAQQIEASMQRLGGYTDQLQERVQGAMNQMKLGVGLLAVGVGSLAPFFKGAQIQSEFEQAEIGLTTLLGSAERAKEVFAEIKAQAAATPFETQDLLLANQAIISQGIEANKSMAVVQNLGNALSAMGKGSAELSAMAVNLQQIAATGKASALDMKQFAYRGINMWALVAESTGKSVEELQKADVTFEMISAALAKASGEGGKYAGAMERMSQSVAGKISTMRDNISFTLAGLGKAIEPITHAIVGGVITLMESLQVFAQSPIGQFVFRLAFAFGLLATAIGVVLIVGGAMKLLMFKLAESFTGQIRVTLLQTMANGGLAASFSALASAVWATIAPMLPMIAAVAAVAAAIYGMYWLVTRSTQAFNELDMTLANPTGFKGFMAKLGGFLQVIKEVWNTWNGLTFTLSVETEERLKKLGIYETALAIATWVVRIKEFFGGVWEGMKEAGKAVMGVISSVFSAISSVVNSAFDMIGISVNKNTSAIKDWAFYGKVAGYIIIGVIAALTVAMAAFAVAQIIAFAPILLTFAAVAAAAFILYEAFLAIRWAVMYVYNAFKPFFNILFAVTKLVAGILFDVLKGIWVVLKGIGTVVRDVVVMAFKAWWFVMQPIVTLIQWLATTLWDNLKPVFEWVGAAITDYIVPVFQLMGSVMDAVVHTITAVFDWAYDKIMTVIGWIKDAWDWVKGVGESIANTASDAWGSVTGGGLVEVIRRQQLELQGNVTTNAPTLGMTYSQNTGEQQGAMQNALNQTITNTSTVQNQAPIVTQLYIDGDKVAESVNNRNAVTDSRN